MDRLEISLEELKKIQIEILDDVHSFCEQKGLTYFLSSGTLIGAIRHKGYIPWDDDIDIYMPRKDYDAFAESYNHYAEGYRMVTLSTDDQCSIAYGKVEKTGTRIVENVDNPMRIGVNIDVFPLDGVPDDEKHRKRYFNRLQRLRYALVLKDVSVNWKSRSFVKNMTLVIGKILLAGRSLRDITMQFDRMIDRTLDKTKYVCNITGRNDFGIIFSRAAINGTDDVEFEGKMYKTMVGWDEYLTTTYGDYLTPPYTRVTSLIYSVLRGLTQIIPSRLGFSLCG